MSDVEIPFVVISPDKNANLVRSVLQGHPEGLTRQQLCAKTHLPRTTIYDALVRLLDEKLVDRQEVIIARRKGRPKVYWSIQQR
jgi:predicted transcriptional regulator